MLRFLRRPGSESREELPHAMEERRTALRRIVNMSAAIHSGISFRSECTIVNISEGGAMLAVAAARLLPDAFTLVLTPLGQPERLCRVVWRGEDRVGVAFQK